MHPGKGLSLVGAAKSTAWGGGRSGVPRAGGWMWGFKDEKRTRSASERVRLGPRG